MENKQKSNLFSPELWKTIIGIVIILIINCFKEKIKQMFNISFIQDTFLKDKLNEGCIFIASSIVYYLAINIFINITGIITTPIKIKLKLTNYIDGDDSTKIIHFGDSDKDDILNEIKVIMEINRAYSFWNWLAIKILKNKKIEVFIKVETSNDEIICQPCRATDEFEDYGYSFGIKINNLCISNLKHGACFKKEYRFLVAENRDKPCSGNCELPIIPTIRLDGRELNFIYKRFIDINNDMEKGYYPIKYSLYKC